jgi:hypothetical protein
MLRPLAVYMRLQKEGCVDMNEKLKVDNSDDSVRRDGNILQMHRIKIGARRKRRIIKRK